MSTFAERITQTYPQQDYVCPTTKEGVLKLIDGLKQAVGELDAFSAFPEGASGILLYALLSHEALACPDVGDFNHQYQGLQMALEASYREIAGSTKWF